MFFTTPCRGQKGFVCGWCDRQRQIERKRGEKRDRVRGREGKIETERGKRETDRGEERGKEGGSEREREKERKKPNDIILIYDTRLLIFYAFGSPIVRR